MDVYSIDFETAWSKDYSLSKKDTTTQSYIDDERFEVIGVSVKKNSEEPQWFSGTHEETKDWLKQFDWESSFALMHNALFDATILAWKFGIYPKLLLCTLSMARAVHGVDAGGSLAKLAERYNLGVKGTEVVDAMGKRRADFSEAELARYGEYCKNDVALTYDLFRQLASSFDKTEIALIDMTIKMHTMPQFELDRGILEEHLQNVRQRKEQLLDECGIVKDDLMSNPKLAEVLKNFGVEPPTKISPTTGEETYAFAKRDEAFKALLEHENIFVQAIVAARLGVKSTIEETRTERFIRIHEAGGALPVPLKYYGAITGRWSAIDSINLQNIPRGSKLKKAIIAPMGYSIVGADLSNIELRVGLAFAGQMDKLEMLGDGLDLYKDFASKAFDVAYESVDDDQRFVGKTACIAEGELVLTDRGLIPIQNILLDDKVWDGVEWVCHDGVAYMGERNVISYQGLTATSDHIVYLEDGTSCEFGFAADKRARIIVTGDEGKALQCVDHNQHRNTKEWQEAVLTDPSALRLRLGEMAASGVIRSGIITFLQAMCIKKSPSKCGAFARWGQVNSATAEEGKRHVPTLQKRARQGIPKLWGAWDSIRVRFDCRVRGLLEDAAKLFHTFICGSHRQRGALHSRQSSFCYAEGTSQQSAQYVLHTMERRENSGIRMERKPLRPDTHCYEVCQTGIDWRRDNTNSVGCSSTQEKKLERVERKVRVYDILNAGPRHRFTVNNLLVSNCLALIYGTGAKKLRAQCKMLSGRDIGEEFSQNVVNIYRKDYSQVRAAWYDAGRALEAIVNNEAITIGLGELKLDVLGRRGIRLPSGLFMAYPDLKITEDEQGRKQWVYGTRKGLVHIHPAKCYQNIIQALARCVMGEAMVRVHKRYPIGLTIHDALYCAVRAEEADQARIDIITELRKAPAWLPNMPLDAEGGYGEDLSFKMKKLEK